MAALGYTMEGKALHLVPTPVPTQNPTPTPTSQPTANQNNSPTQNPTANSLTPTPTIPEFSWFIILPLVPCNTLYCCPN